MDVMLKAIPEPREHLSPIRAAHDHHQDRPRKDRRGDRPGGKTIRGIQDKYSVKIDIQEDGTVFVAADDGPTLSAR